VSGNTPQKRKQPSPSSSSVSDACASPESKKEKHRQDKKKLRQDNMDNSYERQDSMDNGDIQEMLADIQKQIANVATREDINKITSRLDLRIEQLEGDVFELRNEKDVLAAEVKTLKEENKDLRKKLDQYVKEEENIKRSLNDQEQHGRQFNARVHGIPEVKGREETVDDCIGRCTVCSRKRSGY